MEAVLENVLDITPAPRGGVASTVVPGPDDALLDAYSRAVIGAAENASSSVPILEVHQSPEREHATEPRVPRQALGHG